MIYFVLPGYTDVCTLVDKITFHFCDKDLNFLINKLEHDSLLAIEWFESNISKLNQDKCHLIVSGHKHEKVFASLGQSKIWETENQKPSGIIIDRKLNLNH